MACISLQIYSWQLKVKATLMDFGMDYSLGYNKAKQKKNTL